MQSPATPYPAFAKLICRSNPVKPNANYYCTHNFAVRVSEGDGGMETIIVDVIIEPVNDAPVITEGAAADVTMSENGTPTPFNLTLHATDIDSGTLTWSIVTPAGYSHHYRQRQHYCGRKSSVPALPTHSCYAALIEQLLF